MIDWGVPRPEDSRLRLEDYVLDFIPDCLEQVQRDSGEPEVSIDRLLHGRPARGDVRGAAPGRAR